MGASSQGRILQDPFQYAILDVKLTRYRVAIEIIVFSGALKVAKAINGKNEFAKKFWTSLKLPVPLSGYKAFCWRHI